MYSKNVTLYQICLFKYEKKVYTVIVYNSNNINTTNNHLSF